MKIKNYDELTALEIDTLREVGSIGTGNAATSLSQMLGCEVRITLPEVRIMGYNEAIDWIGGPEAITAGVLVGISGEVNGLHKNKIAISWKQPSNMRVVFNFPNFHIDNIRQFLTFVVQFPH